LLGAAVGDAMAFGTGVSFSCATVGAVTTRGVGLRVGFGCGLDVVALAGVAVAGLAVGGLAVGGGALDVALDGSEGRGVGLADSVGSGVTVARAIGIGGGD
jgi:hypothetical protein